MRRTGLTALAIFAVAMPLAAQPQPIGQKDVAVFLDTGLVQNEAESRRVIFAEVVEVPEAPWLRLRFDDAVLGAPAEGGQLTTLRLTSLLDGAVQTMDPSHLRQWRNTSAYFNGDAILLEIIADPSAGPSRVRISSAFTGPPQPGPSTRSICGPDDDRMLSSDPRSARVVPVGCTAWLINDANKCFLTAGHCTGSSFQVVEFNVPLSDAGGNITFADPDDQYPVDPASVQSNGGLGVGNDWAYFGAFANSNTGLTAFEAQGSTYELVSPPDPAGQNIRITGYGTTSAALAPLEWNQVQKTHVGPFVFVSGNTLNYATDTTGGNSGSPVIHEETGNAIGIHTHAGCTTSGGGNNGTNIDHPALQDALANPTGVCRPDPPLAFNFPDGLPELLSPAGDTIRVEVTGQNGGTPQAGTGMLTYDLNDGGGPTTVAMTEVSPNVYDAVFPALPCGTVVFYEFSAMTTLGDTVVVPDTAPDRRYISEAANSLSFAFEDDFETDMGWTVDNDASLTDGAWERGVPAGDGLRGDPLSDADGSGSCYLTDNVAGNSDVDGGATRLVSPTLDASTGDPYICYWLWYDSSQSGTQDDVMVVEISDDDGGSWTALETIGPTGPGTSGGWMFKSWRVADFVTPTNQVRVRFIAEDINSGGVVEAAVDGVRLKRYICDDCFGDFNGDGMVNLTDVHWAAAHWSAGNLTGDLNGDGSVDMLDMAQLTASYGDCP